MTKSVIKKILLTLMVIVFASPVFANSHKGKAMHHLKMMDTNNDGQISATEHATAAAKRFQKMDTNNDGFATKAELKAMKEKMRAKHKAMKEKKGMKEQRGMGN